jgi:hypothetical protein
VERPSGIRSGPDRPDLENAIAALVEADARLTRLHEYAIHRSYPPWVRAEVEKALLSVGRATKYLGIDHSYLTEAALEERLV